MTACLCTVHGPAAADTAPGAGGGGAQAAAATAAVERLPNGDVRLGSVTVHRKQREVSFPAVVNMDTGQIDVLVSTPVGRLYEALLRTDVHPLHFQTMLYLLGLKNGPRFSDEEGRQGDLVDIDLEWQRDDGTTVREPVERWLCDERTSAVMTRCGWVFVGSSIEDGVFLAAIEGNLVVTFSAGESVLDIPDKGGNKAWTFYVNGEKTEPGKDAKVRVIVIPRSKTP